MFIPTARPSLTSRRISELRREADQKVRVREIFLGGLRGVLFPPESTSSPETAEGSTKFISHRSDPLPSTLSPSKASPPVFRGPSIREVQAAVGHLREASLCVVEAIQAWQRARQVEAKQSKQGCDLNKNSSVTGPSDAGGDHKASIWDASRTRVEHRESAAGEVPETRELPDLKFPVVPTTRPTFAGDEDLPIFLWLPPEERGLKSGSDIPSASHRSSLDPETAVPEKAGHDLNGDALASVADDPRGHRHSDHVGGSAAPATTNDANADSTSDGKASLAHHASSALRTPGVNYLARMATDTDFVGAPGSVLADFFPPDAKLFRNPFILGHNLDDTLAVFTNGGGTSPRDRGRQDRVETAGSSPATLKKGRLDTRRVRQAAAIIVAEDARECSGRGIKRHRNEGGKGAIDTAGEGDGVPSGIAAEEGGGIFNTKHDGQHSGRPDSGCSRNADGDHGGRDESSKKKRGKGGITFEDQQSKGRIPDAQHNGHPAHRGWMNSKKGQTHHHQHHPGKLKRGRRGKTMSHLETSGDADDSSPSSGIARPGSTGITKHSRHGGSERAVNWTNMAKAVKEPAYKGPWVPVLLDTNVSCPEGINEVLAEDDVSWQLKAGDRIRIGCCTGHEWEVESVIVVPHGKGKCRISLTEIYHHAEAMRPQHQLAPHAQDLPALQPQQHHHHTTGGHGHERSSPHATGSAGRGDGDGGGRTGGHGARLVRGGTHGGSSNHDRSLLRTASSHSNVKASTAAAAGTAASTAPSSSRPAATSSSMPLLPAAAKSLTSEGAAAAAEKAGSADAEASAAAGGPHPGPRSLREPKSSGTAPVTTTTTTTGEEKQNSPAAVAPGANGTGALKSKRGKSAAGNKKQLGGRSLGVAGPAAPSLSAAGASPKKAGVAATGGNLRTERTAGAHHDGVKNHGGGGGGGRGKGHHAARGESPEKHVARNLEIFQQNLAGLSLPEGATGKGAGGGRRRSLLGGYKAHSEAVQECRQRHPQTSPSGETHQPADNGTVAPHEEAHDSDSGARKRSRTRNDARKTRRLSEAPKESERMPGAELAGGKGGRNGGLGGGLSGGSGGGGGGGGGRVGGLARCQRIWKMVPQAKDDRPTWLRQYEDGSIVYGSHHQTGAGRRQEEVHFRVRLSWAKLESIVVDRPNTRRFARFRPKQRYTFFRKLGLEDLLAIAFRETVAASGVPHGTEKTPAELNLKGWHAFVLSLGFIADASQPARHHDIEQIFRQRTRQYKVELKKLEAIAAKERERALAEERAHARRLAALGDAAGGADDQKGLQQNWPTSMTGTRPGTVSTTPCALALTASEGSRPKTGARTPNRGRAEGKSGRGVVRRGVGTAVGGVGGRKAPGTRGNGREAPSSIDRAATAGSQRSKTSGTRGGPGHKQAIEGGGRDGAGAGHSQPSAAAHAAKTGEGGAAEGHGAPAESVRGHQQVVMKHVLDQDLRMDLAGFKDALTALVVLRQPELENNGEKAGLRDLVFNHLLVRRELESVREMAWLKAKNAAIRAEAPLQCAAVRIQAVWRRKWRTWIYRRQWGAALFLHTWIRMAVKRRQYLAELRRLEALRVAALRKAASTAIQTWFRRISWMWKFAGTCEKRRLETLRKLREWRAVKRRKRRRREEATVFRQSRDLNGCMVMVSMSKKGQRGLDMHVRAYVPATQETFRFVITEKALHSQLCRALKTESLSGAEILENLDLVAARLSCRKQRDGRRWVVSRAKRVAAESGSLVYRVASRLDGTLYFFKVFRSATEVAVTAYEPKSCETLRTILPIRGAKGISVWIKFEVEMATTRRKREVLRRLAEVQKILKLHEMNVEIERPKLLAARRLGDALQQSESSLAAATAVVSSTKKTGAATGLDAANLLEAPLGVDGGIEEQQPGYVSPSTGISAGGMVLSSAAATTEAPPADAELTGMGTLPFAWYRGAVPDLELFADGAPLETDEVASAPDIDITARGREATLARWILRRVKVVRVRVVDVVLPRGGAGGGGWDKNNDKKKKERAPRPVARWERVLVTFYEVETRRRNLAASRVQGLSRMKKARNRARNRILSQFEKRFDVYSGTFYYHSNKTGQDTFAKPRLLLPDQDLEEPPDQWIEQKDRSGKVFYTNPATGQRSHLSVPEAAALIVKACRRHLQAFYCVPEADAIERGVRFSREAKEAWTQGGGRLASTLNYALVLHTHLQDFDTAGPLYDTALKLSGENPLVQRACGLFLISSCRFPREQSRSKGLALLNAAEFRDRDMNTFALAEGAFYHFGLLSTPTHARALLNWALVLEHVRRDADQAELFYRRALAANDLDPLVLANYKSFCLERLPGGTYPGGGPGSRVLRRSRLDDQSPAEGGVWKRYRDPKASAGCLATFWFNLLQQETSWQGPPPAEGAESGS
ncbi:unnamed protein product [Pylaiella littoralis]